VASSYTPSTPASVRARASARIPAGPNEGVGASREIGTVRPAIAASPRERAC